MKLIPYLNFNSNCEEALNFYKRVFNGTIEQLSRYEGSPMPVPESHKNKILHSVFHFGDNSLMACDSFAGNPVESGSKISLSIGVTNEEETHQVFNGLAEGGKITMPLEKQFWGALFGQVTDRFGVKWMVNCEIGEVK